MCTIIKLHIWLIFDEVCLILFSTLSLIVPTSVYLLLFVGEVKFLFKFCGYHSKTTGVPFLVKWLIKYNKRLCEVVRGPDVPASLITLVI